MARNSPLEPGRFGCGFLLLTCLLTCLLLLLNGALVTAFYQWLTVVGPPWLAQPKLGQISMFIAPLLLLVAQWWLVDLLVDRFLPRRREG